MVRFALLLLLAVACSVFAGGNSYGVRHEATPKGFPPAHASGSLAPSVWDSTPFKTEPPPHSTSSTTPLSSGGGGGNHDGEEEPSDLEVWSAIATSLAQWRQNKLRKKSHVHRRDEEVVCYRSVGCFRDEGPFDYLDTLPQSPEAIGTQFLLHTRVRPMEGDVIRYDNASTLHNSRFNSTQPVKVVIHGFGSSGVRAWVKQMTEALLYVGDFNVIVVDWEKGASLPNYVQAAANVQLVGRQVARMLEMLHVEMQVDYRDVHLIGFSLGAHVAGYAGMETKELGRISGLDPASPLFEGYNFNARLDPTDAAFVDVIHSNGDSFLRGGLGAFEPMGHVDFYPNGGKAQLGCNSVFMGAISDIFYGNWQSLCNHRRAFKFFTDSINPNCTFPAFPCESFDMFMRGQCFQCPQTGCAHMGYYADKSRSEGKQFLVTRHVEPFCANQKKIELSSTKGQGKTWGKLEVTFHSQGGINETFLLSMESQEIEDGHQIQGVVVTQPEFQNVKKVSIKYTKYKGWIYSGKEEWYLDKISISDSSGNRYSYCGYRTAVKDKESATLPLTAGDCKVDTTPRRSARLIWEVIEGPVMGANPQPPKMVWRIAIDNNEKYH